MDRSGKLGYEEFKNLWSDIRLWKVRVLLRGALWLLSCIALEHKLCIPGNHKSSCTCWTGPMLLYFICHSVFICIAFSMFHRLYPCYFCNLWSGKLDKHKMQVTILQSTHCRLFTHICCSYISGPKFTDDLRTILRQWPILRQYLRSPFRCLKTAGLRFTR